MKDAFKTSAQDLPDPKDEIIVRQQARIAELEQRLLEAELNGVMDPLTGVANRAGFYAAIAEHFQNSDTAKTKAHLAMFDLNGFKAMNDKLGHAMGDEILKHFAAKIENAFSSPEQNRLIRMGGDEFILLILDGTTPGQTSWKLDQFKSGGISNYDEKNGVRYETHFSYGLSNIKQDKRIETSLAAADRALYKAKDSKTLSIFSRLENTTGPEVIIQPSSQPV